MTKSTFQKKTEKLFDSLNKDFDIANSLPPEIAKGIVEAMDEYEEFLIQKIEEGGDPEKIFGFLYEAALSKRVESNLKEKEK